MMKITDKRQLRPGMRVMVEVSDYTYDGSNIDNATNPRMLPTQIKQATINAPKCGRLSLTIDGETSSSGKFKNMRAKGYVSAPFGGTCFGGRWFWMTCKVLETV